MPWPFPTPRRDTTLFCAVMGSIALGSVLFLVTADEKPWGFTEKILGRLAEEKDIPVRWHAAIGLWWGALANVIISIGLILLSPWLCRPLERQSPPFPKTPLFLKTAILLSAASAIIFSAVKNAPRLNHSLWGDESHTMRKCVVGEFSRDGNDTLVFKQRPWRDTFFNYKSPNNHIFFSVVARLFHGPGRTDPSDPSALYFSEVRLRAPAFVTGLAALAAIAWFLVLSGFPRAAAIAPWILALHPWFVRYGTEARGYAFVLLFLPLCFGALIGALRSGRWSSWLAFGLLQFLSCYTYPATLYVIVMVNLFALAAIWWSDHHAPDKKTLTGRWFAASSISAMGVIQLMAPCVAQLRHYFETGHYTGRTGAIWIADALSYLATGVPFTPWDANNPYCISWLQTQINFSTVFTLLALAIVIGSIILFRRSRLTRLFLLVLTVPVPLAIVHSFIAERQIYHWYLLPNLIAVVALLAVGVTWPRRSWALIGLVFIFAFGLITAPQRQLLYAHSSEPTRESVSLTRDVLNPFHPGIENVLTAGFHMEARGYDPAAHRIKSATALKKLIARADASGRDLFVNFSQYGLAQQLHPEIIALLEDPDLFEPIDALPGLSDQCTRHVYRHLHPSPKTP